MRRRPLLLLLAVGLLAVAGCSIGRNTGAVPPSPAKPAPACKKCEPSCPHGFVCGCRQGEPCARRLSGKNTGKPCCE